MKFSLNMVDDYQGGLDQVISAWGAKYVSPHTVFFEDIERAIELGARVFKALAPCGVQVLVVHTDGSFKEHIEEGITQQ